MGSPWSCTDSLGLFQKKSFTASPLKCGVLLCQLERTLLKGVAGAPTPEWLGLCESRWGSASELDHHLLLCKDLGFLQGEDYKRTSKALVEIRKMLSALLDSIEAELKIKVRATAQG